MIYIYGGGFTSGTSSLTIFNGATFADQKDVIIVTFNYRLSILGWPGNPTAQNNAFGGDPERTTLFGQSAGSTSTDYYSYAWSLDPIISGIILELGTSFSFGLPFSESDSTERWYNVTETLGCGDASTSSTTLLACMRNVEIDFLLNALLTTGLNPLASAFGPTVDNSTIFSNYSQQTPAGIPVLLGSNDYESGIWRTELALSNLTIPDSIWDAYNLAAFTCPAGLRANASIAASNPTWRYRYFGIFPDINISSEGRAYHGAKAPLLFRTTSLFSTLNSTLEEVNFETYMRGAWNTLAQDPVNGLMTY